MKKNDKATILIVDDNKANILTLENLLVSKDRAVISANSGDDALKTALNKLVDLIILDVHMPGMDGFEVAQILKSNKKTRDIPIIFASAEKTEHKSMMQGFEEGAIDYLFKPLDPEILKAKVAVLLKVQLQKKELIEKNISLTKSDLLINNSADIIGIIDEATFRIEEINTAVTTILGYSIKEVKGGSVTFYLHNEDRELFQAMAKKQKERFSLETRIYCKDRSIKWLQWKVVVKERKWFVNARDITEIKEGERIRNYLATVVKQSNDAIYIHNHDGKIISWNEGAEKIYGYTEQEALKMHIWNIIPGYMQAGIEELVNDILKGTKIRELESKRITKHGKLVDVLFSASVISGSQNDRQSIAITERDITQQKIADEQIQSLNRDLQANNLQLETANKELEAFSYSVSHDLRSPLRALNGYSQIFEEDYKHTLDDEAKRLLGKIQNSAVKMGLLIDDLLTFSRLGRKSLQKSETDMGVMVANVINEISQGSGNEAKIAVGDLQPAAADASLLYQVWMNLISNAIKYSSKKEFPEVQIGSSAGDSEITYYVKDNGAGFSMQYADKLFGVFQRLHSDQQFEGTGIGLAIVKRIITRHGGKVWAEAKEGEGATFYFTLPV